MRDDDFSEPGDLNLGVLAFLSVIIAGALLAVKFGIVSFAFLGLGLLLSLGGLARGQSFSERRMSWISLTLVVILAVAEVLLLLYGDGLGHQLI